MNQLALFDDELRPTLMRHLKKLPKVDLHRHLTGSITIPLAVTVALENAIALPSYIHSELNDFLFGAGRVQTLEEYFEPWAVLNRLFKTEQSTASIIEGVIKEALGDNVCYVELRTSPRGFLGDSKYDFDEYLSILADATQRGSLGRPITVRWIIGIPRHVFGRINEDSRQRMMTAIVRAIKRWVPNLVVGVDLNGVESAAAPEEFRSCFDIANESGIPITAHAGETGPPADVSTAILQLNASRIGHGVAASRDREVLALAREKGTVLEVCPTSNVFLGLFDTSDDLPYSHFQREGVRFAICSDNPARCSTSSSEELYKYARATNASFEEIVAHELQALDAAFANLETKAEVRDHILSVKRQIQGTLLECDREVVDQHPREDHPSSLVK